MALKGHFYDMVNAQTFTDAVDAGTDKGPMPVFGSSSPETSPSDLRTFLWMVSRYSLQFSDFEARMRAASVGSIVLDEIIEDEVKEKKDELNRLKRGFFVVVVTFGRGGTGGSAEVGLLGDCSVRPTGVAVPHAGRSGCLLWRHRFPHPDDALH